MFLLFVVLTFRTPLCGDGGDGDGAAVGVGDFIGIQLAAWRLWRRRWCRLMIPMRLTYI